MSPKNKKYRRAFTPTTAPAASVGSTQAAPAPAPTARMSSRNLSTAVEAPTAQSFKRDLGFYRNDHIDYRYPDDRSLFRRSPVIPISWK